MIATVLSNTFLLIGSLALIIGSLGMMRFPDFYARTHAAGVTETAGSAFIMIGLMFAAGPTLITLKLLVVLSLLLYTSPTAGHALAQAALVDGQKPVGRIETDENAA